ncbi:MAG: DUF2298 domain-containing protein [Anaerolineae bacterium]
MGTALLWWLQISLLGWLVWPLAARIFRHAPGRGYAYTRILGLLALAVLQWLGSLAGLLDNGATAIRLTAGVLAVGSLVLWAHDGADLLAWLRRNRLHILSAEALAAAAFALYALQRVYDPAIAHTEQPMDMAMLAGILRSPRMPPHDPWLAGHTISYYYLVYQTVAVLCKLGGVPAGLGYNLGLAHTLALAVLGAYGVLYDLLAPARRTASAAATGGLALVLAGNLVGPLGLLRNLGLGGDSLYRWLGVPGMAEAPRDGLVIPGEFWWWWRASRAFDDANWLGRSPTVITEFPAFSFVLGDLHPHVMALPYLLVVVALAVELYRLASADTRSWWREPAIWMAAPVVGALGFLNSWDLPTGWALVALAYGMGLGRRGRAWIAGWGPPMVTVVAGSLLLYTPFYLGLQSQVQGLGLVTYTKTRLPSYLLCFGLWLLPITYEALRERVRSIPWRRIAWVWGGLLLLPWIVTGVLGGWGRLLLGAITSLANGPWLLLYLSGLLTLLLVLIGHELSLPAEARDTAGLLAHTLVALGLGLSYAVEFFYVRDLFDTRMNTVFKAYYQIWVLLALGGITATVRLWRGRGAARMVALLSGLLLLTCLSYTPAAAYSKAGGYQGPRTLDGTAFLRQESPGEYAAYLWLDANAVPAAVLMEAPGNAYMAQHNRISAFTGLPSVLGWAGHEVQWRGEDQEVRKRQADLGLFYTTESVSDALTILNDYGVRYVYVGPHEQELYSLDAERLRWLASFLTPVIEQDGIVLFQVPTR